MKIFLRIVGIAVLFVLSLAGVGGGLFYAFVHHFNPDPPDADYGMPKDALEAQRQDFDYLGRLIALDRAYSPQARAQAQRRLSALAASAKVLDRGQMRATVASLAALADNGHTSVFSKKPTRAILLPLRLASFSDGLFVMRVKKGNEDLLGAEVVAIDGHPVGEVLEKLAALRGGTHPWRLEYARLVLTSSEFLHGLGLAPAVDRSTWTFRTRSGQAVERGFVGTQPDYDAPWPDPWRWQSPEKVKGDSESWIAFTPEGWRAPLTFQLPDEPFRRARIGCAMLIQLKANQGDGLRPFLEETEADLAAHRPCAIIFDNRFNGGGDYTNTAGFADRLPELTDGHIYLLTGVETFSAGITTTVFIKQAARPGQVVLLGEEVGDRLQFYSEGNEGCLPNAPFCFRYATGMHDYVHPCTDWDRCFWLNWLYPARTDNLRPSETITQSFADYLAGRDPVFDRALALVKRS